MYAAGAAWLFISAYPAFLLAGSASLAGALIGQFFLAFGVPVYTSAMFVGLIELFPTAVRCRSHGISYNAAVAIFGGTTPLVAAALIVSHRKFAGTSLLRYGDHRRLRHCRNRARARNEGRESTRVDLLKSAMVMILYMGMCHGRDLATNVSLLRTT